MDTFLLSINRWNGFSTTILFVFNQISCWPFSVISFIESFVWFVGWGQSLTFFELEDSIFDQIYLWQRIWSRSLSFDKSSTEEDESKKHPETDINASWKKEVKPSEIDIIQWICSLSFSSSFVDKWLSCTNITMRIDRQFDFVKFSFAITTVDEIQSTHAKSMLVFFKQLCRCSSKSNHIINCSRSSLIVHVNGFDLFSSLMSALASSWTNIRICWPWTPVFSLFFPCWLMNCWIEW